MQALAIDSGGSTGVDALDDVTEDQLNLPAGFGSKLRAHVFAAFPLDLSAVGSLSVATTNEQQYRALNAVNAECVALMSAFIPPAEVMAAATAAAEEEAGEEQPAASSRRKSGASGSVGAASSSARQLRQASEDASTWLAAVLRYMGDSFASLTERAQAKEQARMLHQQATMEQQQGAEEEDDEMIDAAAASSAAAAAASAPVTPARTSQPPGAGRSHSKKKGPSGSSARMLEHGSLTELLPLLQNLLPRLSGPQQDWLIQCFSTFYLAVHPLSSSKLACVRFLHDYLLVPSVSSGGTAGGRGAEWMRRAASLRHVWVDQGEWAHLLTRVSSALAEASSAGGAGAGVVVRYVEMLDLLLNVLLNCGRIFHAASSSVRGAGQILDYNVLQEQLLPFFGVYPEDAADTQDQQHPVVPGPFWSLPLALQHKSVLLLFYFDALDPYTLQLLLDCLRDNIALASSNAASLSLDAKLLLLDMLEEKRRQSARVPDRTAGWPLMPYLSFLIGCIRADVTGKSASGGNAVCDPSRVSPLLPTVCRMLRSVGADEIDSALLAAGNATAAEDERSAPPGELLELLAPVLAASMQAAVTGAEGQQGQATSSPPKLDALSSLVLLDSLLAHSASDDRLASCPLPASLAPLLPPLLFQLLSQSVSGSMLEGGLVRPGRGWLDQSVQEVLQGDKPWIIAMRVLHRSSATADVSASPLSGMLALMRRTLSSAPSASASLAVVVVLGALLQCAGGVRELLQRPPFKADVLALAASAQSMQGIASQTLMALLQAELALLFGRQAEAAAASAMQL